MKPLKIESTQNSRLKAAIKLRDRSYRDKTRLFGVEGGREISRAIDCGYQLSSLFFCCELLSSSTSALYKSTCRANPNLEVLELSKPCFNKLVVRQGFDGLYGIFEQKKLKLADLVTNSKTLPTFLILENIEKPGNLGALLRSADAANACGVILLGNCSDPYSPQAIRSSLGTVFSTPICEANILEAKNWLKDNRIELFSASLEPHSRCYTTVDLSKASAIALGSEANGLSREFYDLGGQRLKLPMLGIADSLNVSVAGAIFLYESLRQKNLSTTN